MPTVFLGNSAVIATFGEAQAVVHPASEAPPTPGNSVARPELGQQVTTISPPAGLSTEQQVEAVVGAFAACSSQTPAWVEGDDDDLVSLLAERYDCPIGCPVTHDEWKEG